MAPPGPPHPTPSFLSQHRLSPDSLSFPHMTSVTRGLSLPSSLCVLRLLLTHRCSPATSVFQNYTQLSFASRILAVGFEALEKVTPGWCLDVCVAMSAVTRATSHHLPLGCSTPGAVGSARDDLHPHPPCRVDSQGTDADKSPAQLSHPCP